MLELVSPSKKKSISEDKHKKAQEQLTKFSHRLTRLHEEYKKAHEDFTVFKRNTSDKISKFEDKNIRNVKDIKEQFRMLKESCLHFADEFHQKVAPSQLSTQVAEVKSAVNTAFGLTRHEQLILQFQQRESTELLVQKVDRVFRSPSTRFIINCSLMQKEIIDYIQDRNKWPDSLYDQEKIKTALACILSRPVFDEVSYS